MLRLLFLGDIVGRAGRDAVAAVVPALRARLQLDLVIANGENAAHGFGITPLLVKELRAMGVDVVTLGNHAWDQKEIMGYIETDPMLIRPANYPGGTPGRGNALVTLPGGAKVLVIQLMGRLFMDPLDDPFPVVDRLLEGVTLGGSVQAIVVDVHAEASSEKMALGHHLDGRASLVVGTHTHVPTADAQILPGGTAYMTDAGMCGDYDSVIGMAKQAATSRMRTKLRTERLTPATGEGTACGLLLTVDPATGLATAIEPVRMGGRLAQAVPAVV